MSDGKSKVTQKTLNDFIATVDNYQTTLKDEEIFQKFPEFGGDKKLLQAAKDYYTTFYSGDYKDPAEINDKFPEFFRAEKKNSLPEQSGLSEASGGEAPSTSVDTIPQDATYNTAAQNAKALYSGQEFRNPDKGRFPKTNKIEEATVGYFLKNPPSYSQDVYFNQLKKLGVSDNQLIKLRELGKKTVGYGEEINQLTEAVNANPQDISSSQALANIYTDLGQNNKAEQLYLNVLRSNPNQPQALNGLAYTEFKRGNIEEAKELYKEAVDNSQAGEKDLGALYNLYTLSKLTGDEQAAEKYREDFNFYKEQTGNIEYSKSLGQFAEDLAKGKGALAMFNPLGAITSATEAGVRGGIERFIKARDQGLKGSPVAQVINSIIAIGEGLMGTLSATPGGAAFVVGSELAGPEIQEPIMQAATTLRELVDMDAPASESGKALEDLLNTVGGLFIFSKVTRAIEKAPEPIRNTIELAERGEQIPADKAQEVANYLNEEGSLPELNEKLREAVTKSSEEVQLHDKYSEVIPERIKDPEKRVEISKLLEERSELEKSVEGKDKALTTNETSRIKEINEQLTKLSEAKEEVSTTETMEAPQEDVAQEIYAEPAVIAEPVQMAIDPMEAVKKVREISESSIKEYREKFSKPILKTFAKEGMRKWIDVSGNVKEALLKKGGKDVVIKKDLIAGSNAIAADKYRKASEVIFDGLKVAEEKNLADLIKARRTIELDTLADIEGKPRLKHEGGANKELYESYIEGIKNENPEAFEDLNRRADEYFSEMNKTLDTARQEGLVSEDLYNTLAVQKNYSPRKFLEYLDPEITIEDSGGRKITVSESGLKKLDEGSEGALVNDPRVLLQEVISRTESRIAKNRAAQELLKFAEANPDNGIVKVFEPEGFTEAGAPKYPKTPPGFSIVNAMVDGQKKPMLMPNEFAKEWVQSEPLINQNLAEAIQFGTGAATLKLTATGINPQFIFTNFPRDIAYTLLTTEVYSPVLPKALGQIGVDIATVFKDAITRKGRYKDYINEGGGMEFLTAQGRLFRGSGVDLGPVKRSLNAVTRVLGYLNETSEIMTRLAIRERELKKGKTPEEATWQARTMIDFSQGGSYAKAIDKFIPYFNASLQGSRGIFRAAKRNPKVFGFKVAQLGSLSAGLYLYNLEQEGFQDIDEDIKSRNFIIMLPYSRMKNGKRVYSYITIPKSHDQRFITGAFEGIAEMVTTGNAPSKKLWQDVKALAPPTPVDIPIINAISTYYSNYDMFKDEKVWKSWRPIEPEAEFHSSGFNKTPEVYVEWGELTGASPERTRRAVSKVVANPENNFYAAITGKMFNVVTDALSEGQKEELNKDFYTHLDEILSPMERTYLKETNPFKREFNEKIRKKISQNTRRKLSRDEEE